MTISRSARVTWEGSNARGGGTISAASSGAFTELPFRELTRVADHDGQTSPEELLAAAHAGCYAMSLAFELSQAKTPPGSLEVRCTISLAEADGSWQIVRSQLDVRGSAPKADASGFEAAARAADSCPFSTLIRAGGGAVDITTTWEGNH
ncbi:MAG: OsmC family peroxiredoxin [Gaiella sp.]